MTDTGPQMAALVCDHLAGATSRRMFGGWGIYLDGRMIAIVHDGRVYAKATTPDAPRRHLEAGMGQFTPRPGQTLGSYWEVPPDDLDTPDRFRAWFDI